jgi:hypothetical protein
MSHKSGGHVFSVMYGLCRVYIREPNSKARSCRSREESKRMEILWHTTEYKRMRVRLSVGDSHGKLAVIL